VPASPLRAARAAQADAEDDLGAARAALEQLRTALADLEAESGHADIALDVAVNSVLAAEAAVALVEKLERLKQELPALQAQLHFLRNRSSLNHGAYRQEVPELAAPFAEIAPRIRNAVELGLPFHVAAAEQHPAVEPWRAACAAMRRGDPDAPLPP
jgi:multidrug efflux pump subunit AcrA (membrane-fusion protein)